MYDVEIRRLRRGRKEGKMIKRCSGVKLFCDACGKSLANVIFNNREAAIMYAVCFGMTCREVPFCYCGEKCKRELRRLMRGEEKGGKSNG